MDYQFVLLRHGESTWNHENRFTGWTDVGLTERGIAEARQAGLLLHQHGLQFDLAYTSVLKRAIQTLWYVLEALDRMWIPVVRDWRLNERHYGALQGLNKEAAAEALGREQVHNWRRSYRERPPALAADDHRHPAFDPRYTQLPPQRLPASESLADTHDRVQACWNERLLPALLDGRKLLIVAHGNSLRALVKQLDQITDEAIPGLYIPTGIPLYYGLDQNLNVVERKYLQNPSSG
jgi:2,3-bisphosphoglycerate-dependent phosphoglycerate mutase